MGVLKFFLLNVDTAAYKVSIFRKVLRFKYAWENSVLSTLHGFFYIFFGLVSCKVSLDVYFS